MTGFASADGAADGYSWTWEVKSVNGRNLDLRFRLPPGHDFIEAHGRKAAPDRFKRGNLSLHLALRRPEESPGYRVNREAFEHMIALTEELRKDTGGPPARLETVLGLPGVIEPEAQGEEPEEQRARRRAALTASLDEALERLAEARSDEGIRLAAFITDHIEEIAGLCASAAGVAAAQPDALRQRLREQLDALLDADTPLSEERLAQEVAVLVNRADVREELDRLSAHVDAARVLVAEGGAVGRKLDFLCQEFNREANTLCSKSADNELTRIGLDLKAAIDRLREQVQNVE